ncbi:ExeA family protein [Heyndrickxia coagulans]|uniref:ISChy3, Orf3 family protein n=1 Tax=Heyndrickxia coagulans TaxID=1398 RepID=A0A133L0F8_HEYCO|nr:AAA family ATPase [Heyndrickxia coagulans]KWZ85258.1 ISChy3, Orf3 family protein [Heyndrickxia coagulans]
MLDFFEMKGVPFTRENAPDVLFASSSHKEAAARLEYAVQHRQFCLLTGEAGMGKSTAIRSLVHHLDPIHYHYLYICDSSLTPKLFYREVLQNFGIQPAFRSNDVKRQYQSLMLDIYENEKKQIVIVLDEAHHFSDSMLQELRFILNFREDSMSPLTLIVAGQPSLRNLLKVKHLEAIDQRIQMRYQMSSLTERETADYIGHHLRVVETPHEIFSEEAIQAIYNFSQGVPRKVNTLCSQSLLDAFIQGNKVVGESHIHRVINEL